MRVIGFVGIITALSASGATSFSVTPYVQHPATNAMSVIWFAKGGFGEAATISWRPATGGTMENEGSAAIAQPPAKKERLVVFMTTAIISCI